MACTEKLTASRKQCLDEKINAMLNDKYESSLSLENMRDKQILEWH